MAGELRLAFARRARRSRPGKCCDESLPPDRLAWVVLNARRSERQPPGRLAAWEESRKDDHDDSRGGEKAHDRWEAAGVVFIADDLGSWLVGLLADAARKKLTALLLGDEQS